MFDELLTERLRLRRLAPGDEAAVFGYRTDPEVSRYQLWVPGDVAEVRRFLDELAHLEPDTPGTWFQLGIVRRADGVLLGDCGMRFPLDDRAQAEIGITLAPAHQGHGYARETLRAVLDYLFVGLGKHRVFGSVDPRNAPSIALLDRLGFRRETHLRESVRVRGEWADDLVYAILAREWRT
jgi:RimJ/RimL family protein N-acetyltransferase